MPLMTFETGGRIPVRENMRNVPKTFDGGDVSDNAEGTGPGRWHGEQMSCLECHETRPVTMGITATYMLATLECDECGETFAEFWQ